MSRKNSEHMTFLSGVLSALFGALTGLVLIVATLRPAYATVPSCVDCTAAALRSQTLQPLETLQPLVSPAAQTGLQLSGQIAQIFAPQAPASFAQALTTSLAEQLAQFTPMGLLRQSMSPARQADFDKIPLYDLDDPLRVPSPTMGQVDARFAAGAGGDSAERIGQMMRANAFPGVFDVPGVIDAARLSGALSQL